MTDGITIREFARREGCSEGTVRKAIKAGRLAVLVDGSLDPALVGTWRAGQADAPHGTHTGTQPDTCVPQERNGTYSGTHRRWRPRSLLGLPVVGRRYVYPDGDRLFVGLITRDHGNGTVDVIALLPRGTEPIPRVRLCKEESPSQGSHNPTVAWLAG
jgi:hypothetical protein